jgi:hypothetical protein
MASILNVTNLAPVNVTANAPDDTITNDSGVTVPSNEYAPRRLLKNSVASTAPFKNHKNDFAALGSDIPDGFATNEQPKLKFLFTVQFFPRDGLKLLHSGDQDMTKMAFALKRATRPQPNITYQDVNFYGLRTKVAIKLDYGTVTLGFYDDVVNRAHNIVTQYIRYVSPISSISKDEADNLDGADYGAITIGAYADNPLGPFAAMRVTHHMLDDKHANTGKAKQVFYDYLNPKILSVNLDDLDMSQSEASMVEVTFVYDSVNITYSDVVTPNPSTTDGNGDPVVIAPTTKPPLTLNDVIPSWVRQASSNALLTDSKAINGIIPK